MTRRIIIPTQEILQDTFDYREDGVLLWKKPKAAWIKIGSIAGSDRGDGYWTVGFGGKLHLLHRMIFLYHKGYLPNLVDHEDTDHTNNRIENLRELDKRGNAYNTNKLWGHNTSGIRGVSWDNTQEKWVVRFKHQDKYLFGGYFDDIELAKEKRLEMERRHLHYD